MRACAILPFLSCLSYDLTLVQIVSLITQGRSLLIRIACIHGHNKAHLTREICRKISGYCSVLLSGACDFYVLQWDRVLRGIAL